MEARPLAEEPVPAKGGMDTAPAFAASACGQKHRAEEHTRQSMQGLGPAKRDVKTGRFCQLSLHRRSESALRVESRMSSDWPKEKSGEYTHFPGAPNTRTTVLAHRRSGGPAPLRRTAAGSARRAQSRRAPGARPSTAARAAGAVRWCGTARAWPVGPRKVIRLELELRSTH